MILPTFCSALAGSNSPAATRPAVWDAEDEWGALTFAPLRSRVRLRCNSLTAFTLPLSEEVSQECFTLTRKATSDDLAAGKMDDLVSRWTLRHNEKRPVGHRNHLPTFATQRSLASGFQVAAWGF